MTSLPVQKRPSQSWPDVFSTRPHFRFENVIFRSKVMHFRYNVISGKINEIFKSQVTRFRLLLKITNSSGSKACQARAYTQARRSYTNFFFRAQHGISSSGKYSVFAKFRIVLRGAIALSVSYNCRYRKTRWRQMQMHGTILSGHSTNWCSLFVWRMRVKLRYGNVCHFRTHFFFFFFLHFIYTATWVRRRPSRYFALVPVQQSSRRSDC